MIRMVLAGVLVAGSAAAQTALSGFPVDIICYASTKSLHDGERANMALELKRRGHTCTPEDVTKGQESYIKWRKALTADLFREAAGLVFGPAPPAGKTCTTRHIDGKPPETICQ